MDAELGATQPNTESTPSKSAEVGTETFLRKTEEYRKLAHDIQDTRQTLADETSVMKPTEVIVELEEDFKQFEGRVDQLYKHYAGSVSSQGIVAADPEMQLEVRSTAESLIREVVPESNGSIASATEQMNRAIFNEWKKRFDRRYRIDELRNYFSNISTGNVTKDSITLERLVALLESERQGLPETYTTYIDGILEQIRGNDQQNGALQKLVEIWIDNELTTEIQSTRTGSRSSFALQNVLNELQTSRIDSTQANLDYLNEALETFRNLPRLTTLSQAQEQAWNTRLIPIVERIESVASEIETARRLEDEQLHRKIEASASVQESIRKLQQDLSDIERSNLLITSQTRQIVVDAYTPLISEIKRLRAVSTEPGELLRLNELERDILFSEYRVLVKNYDRIADQIERNDQDTGSYTLIDNNVLMELKVVAERLEEQYTPAWDHLYAGEGADSYKKIVDRISNHYTARQFLQLAWNKLAPHVITDEKRSVPDHVSSEKELLMTGVQVHELINGGMYSLEGAERVNLALGRRKYFRLLTEEDVVPDPVRAGKYIPRADLVVREAVDGTKYIEDEFEETAVGFCMRLYDSLYRGDLELYDAKHEKISVKNVHGYLWLMVDHAWKEVNRVAGVDVDEEGWESQAIVPKLVAERALRLSATVTMHQSDLSNAGTTGVSDSWYYMTHWHEYSDKYFHDAKANFSEFITRLLVGDNDINALNELFGGQGEKILTALAETIEKDAKMIDSNPVAKAARLKQLKFSKFHFLKRMPLIKPTDVAIGVSNQSGTRVKRREARTFEAPLSYVSDKKKMYDFQNETLGRVRTYDDVRAYGEYKSGETTYTPSHLQVESDDLIAMRAASGAVVPWRLSGDEFVYEQMDFSGLNRKFLYDYISKLMSGPYPFYNEILSADTDKAVSSISSPSTLQKLRKIVGYIVPFLTGVGIESRYGSQNVAEAYQNQIIDCLMYAVCLIKTSEQTKLEDRWDSQKVYEFVNIHQENGSITLDEAVVIYHATIAGRRFELFTNGVNQTLNKQLESFFRFQA
ncbi:hypothetical protein KBD71_02640 [Candidatus Woesebacteria bacterium]|nr:hypothetical protein [Candidatus Woesebacteria bacterium]